MAPVGPPRESWHRRWLFRLGFGRTSGPRLLRPLRAIAWVLFTTLLVAENPAVRGRRVRAALTYWSCQIRRGRGASFIVDLSPSVRFHMPAWSSLGALVAATGAHEYVEERFVRDLLRPGDVAIDVGANIGFYTVPIAAAGARVWTFEPDQRSGQALEHNVELNRLSDRVRIEALALSDFTGTAYFTTDLDVMNHLVIDDVAVAGAIEVPVRRLDDLVDGSPWPLDDLVLLKVDAEGHDLAVLGGAENLLRDRQPTVLVETNRGGFEVRALLERLDYQCFWYDCDRRQLVPLPQGWAGNFEFHTNLFAVHDKRRGEVEERLRSASGEPLPRPRIEVVPAGG